MTLKEHIDDIHKGLEAGQYGNEAAVSQGVVLRLLGALAWPTFNTQVVAPEYGVEGTRVDFALCHPLSKPLVFVEVKQVGKIEGVEKQLFQYAFHTGVPIAILTDGREWHFFHPSGQGDYKERRVYKLDLIERDSEDSARRLNRYLDYQSIRRGDAVRAIEEDYRNVSRQRQVATRLPEAWDKLVEDADEFLVDVVAEKVESLCGYRPTDEQVLNFLKNLESKIESGVEVPSSPLVQGDPARAISIARKTNRGHSRQQKAKASPRRFIVIMPNNETVESATAQETFVEVLLKLIEMLGEEQVIDADERGSCISTAPLRSGVQGRPYGNYFISTNHGTAAKKRLLDRVAGHLGVQLRVDIIEKS